MTLTANETATVRDMVLYTDGYRRATRFLIDNSHAATNSQARAILTRIIMKELGMEVFDDVHSVRDLECSLGRTITGNAAKLSAALADRSRVGRFRIPAGYFRIDDSIQWPGQTGSRLMGDGCAVKEYNENSYYASNPGGRESRIVWHGPATSPMIDYKGMGGVIEGVRFQGALEIALAEVRNTNPIQIVAYSHGFTSGDVVDITSVDGNTAANGRWTITVTDGNQFTIPVSGVGGGVYNTGNAAGRATRRKALLGVKVDTYSGVGGAVNPGKLMLRDVGFWNVQIPMMFGHDMDNLGAGYYASEDYNNADCSHSQNVVINYPYDNNPNNELRYCALMRSKQSLHFHHQDWLIHGNPDSIFYFERGGDFRATKIHLSGATSTTNPVKFLRLGNLAWPSGSRYALDFYVDGNSGTSGEPGSNFRLLQMDSPVRYGCVQVDLSGGIATYAYQVPIIVARGSSITVIRGTSNLLPGAIQMIGATFGGSQKCVANVHLENCALRGAMPADLVNAGSSGPWRLTWKNCVWTDGTGANLGDYALPIADGALASGGLSVLS